MKVDVPACLCDLKHVISIHDFTRDQLIGLLQIAQAMDGVRQPILDGKILATLFFEPSTRTRLSFEAAMLQLGGRTLGFADSVVSSVKKGETLHDTIRMLDNYADIIVLRHPQEGAARVAAEASRLPVINGGDGSNQHPTQTLVDLYTIWKAFPDLLDRKQPLKITLLGDLRYGRTVHSLIMALTYFNVQFYLVSPPSLKLPNRYKEHIIDSGLSFEEGSCMEDFIRHVNVLYVTRIQQERFPDPVEYSRVKNTYRVTAQTLADVVEDFIIMHPLPRINEIDKSVDDLEVTAYFQQAGFGIPVRKALLSLLAKVI